jgi:excisionase family DNA binding protein
MQWYEKEVLTTGEVAKLCNVAPRTVSKWFDSKQLEGFRIPGSRDRRIPTKNLLRFMKANNIPMDGVFSGRPRVLVVDDASEVTQQLTELLKQQGRYEVRTASNPFLAGMECERFRPHVVLLDIHLGECDPNCFAKAIRSNDDLALTRIVAMSGKLTDGQLASLRMQGYDGFLKKPFSGKQAIEEIEKANALVH